MRFSTKISYLLLTSFFLTAGAAAAAEELLGNAPAAVINGAGKGRSRFKFEYQLDNRPDPFSPFISKKKAITDEEDKIVDPDEGELTGLRLLEPGQLKLVAVMNTPSGPMAMAEDVTGKGYLLREGMLIGKHGEILQIGSGRVSIKETLKTQSGRIIEKDVAMTLKKDDEKKGM